MKKLNQLLIVILVSGLVFSCQSSTKDKSENLNARNETVESLPPIVTQDNFPQAYTNMRFAAVLHHFLIHTAMIPPGFWWLHASFASLQSAEQL